MKQDNQKQDIGFKEVRIDEQSITNWLQAGIASFSLKQTYLNSSECPYCGSHHIHKKGNYRGRKRYKCVDCGKTYNDLTRTPFSGIHDLKKINIYIGCLMQGLSIRKAALIVGINASTSFAWRHKLLHKLNSVTFPQMKNLKEATELKIPYSHKGQRSKLTNELRNTSTSAVFVFDRLGKLDSDSICYNKRDNNPLFKRISEVSSKHSEIIYTPIFPNITNTSLADIASHSTNAPITHINKITRIWKTWMQRFHGVSSKYFRNYLHWFDFLENSVFKANPISDFVTLLLNSY